MSSVAKEKNLPKYIAGLHKIKHISLSGGEILADLHLTIQQEKQLGGDSSLLKDIGTGRIIFDGRFGAL